MDSIEISANAVNAVSIALAARNSVYTWPTGIVGCTLFGVVFFKNHLYADALLQLFFVATSLIGWWQWHDSQGGAEYPENAVTHESAKAIGAMVIVGVVVAGCYGALLYRFTDAYQPYVDSGVLVLSVIAQCLLMRRKVEAWPFWLFVNTVSVCLFASRGLKITALLYAAYWVNAWYGWWRWRGASTQVQSVESLR